MDKDLLDRIERASVFYPFVRDKLERNTEYSMVETLLEDGRVVKTLIHTNDWKIKSMVQEGFMEDYLHVYQSPCVKEMFLGCRQMRGHWEEVANNIQLTAEQEGVDVHDWTGRKTWATDDAIRLREEAGKLRAKRRWRDAGSLPAADWLLYNIRTAELVLVKASEGLSGWTATDGRIFKRSEHIGRPVIDRPAEAT